MFSNKSKWDCDCCSNTVVYNKENPPHNIDIQATCDALIEQCASGKMTVVRGDCPLEKMVELLVSDTKYTIVQFIKCNNCGRIIFWGLCIRGAPIYRISDEREIENWIWE